MTDDELTAKYRANVAGRWTDAKAERVAELVWSIDAAPTVDGLVAAMGAELMVWLTPGSGEHPATRLRAMLDEPGAVAVPGVFNGLTALLARERRRGDRLPVRRRVERVDGPARRRARRPSRTSPARLGRSSASPTCPLIVDADTGFGSALMVMRTVRELEEAGAAAVQIEDQVDPKRCGHLEGKQVTSAARMCEKVAAAREARADLVVVARTDARATPGSTRPWRAAAPTARPGPT